LSSGGVNKPPVTTFAQAYLALSKNPEPEIMDGKAAEEGSIDVKKSGVLPHNNTSISNEKILTESLLQTKLHQHMALELESMLQQ
jgi:hypothetical protein